MGVRLDLALNVNNMGVTLYFGFNLEMGLFSHSRAVAAISARLGQECSRVGRRVRRHVTVRGFDWLGRAINKGTRWVCDTVFDTICRPFKVTASVLNRVHDLTNWMPKLRYSMSNVKIAGPVMIGDVLQFTRMPSNRELQAVGMFGRRRLVEDGIEMGNGTDIGESYLEEIFDGLKAPENADEDMLMADVHEDDVPVDEESVDETDSVVESEDENG